MRLAPAQSPRWLLLSVQTFQHGSETSTVLFCEITNHCLRGQQFWGQETDRTALHTRLLFQTLIMESTKYLASARGIRLSRDGARPAPRVHRGERPPVACCQPPSSQGLGVCIASRRRPSGPGCSEAGAVARLHRLATAPAGPPPRRPVGGEPFPNGLHTIMEGGGI